LQSVVVRVASAERGLSECLRICEGGVPETLQGACLNRWRPIGLRLPVFPNLDSSCRFLILWAYSLDILIPVSSFQTSSPTSILPPLLPSCSNTAHTFPDSFSNFLRCHRHFIRPTLPSRTFGPSSIMFDMRRD